MKKITIFILLFLMSTLMFIACVPTEKDTINPPEEPNYPKYTELAFEVDGEYTTYVHLHIPDSNITTYVNLPKVLVYTKDLLHYEEVESLDPFQISGNDDVAINTNERLLYAKKADTPIIDNLVILSATLSATNEERILQIRVTKGDYEN